ncbi:Na+/H+ antiporter subunit E [Emcibacter sp.]|uniref:Na+/H+ antiporter subunit E n=1 Tax=Emcibacter sp. TaxID=1979954 RepID=UPI002AA7D731|nr:Na+/H+ antiporter subunit E [Emcibacter sp.]
MLRIASLALALGITWLLWSGHVDPLLLGLGVLSIVIVLIVNRRMAAIDEEGVPFQLAGSIFAYWMWLVVEIFKSNVHVARIVLSPKMKISPTIVKVSAWQKSDLGQVLFANSIILTPGTLSLDLFENQVLVHALTKESALEVQAGEMNMRAARVMGSAGLEAGTEEEGRV